MKSVVQQLINVNVLKDLADLMSTKNVQLLQLIVSVSNQNSNNVEKHLKDLLCKKGQNLA